jgi:AcrR family transcriptional regulator
MPGGRRAAPSPASGERPWPSQPLHEMSDTKPKAVGRSYTISLANRKARGSGHERLGEILTAAKELFLEHGFENVSTRKIAARVGISQTALFAYYRTKDEILGQLMRNAFGELARALAELDRTASGHGDWLRGCIAGYVAFGLEHPDEYRLAFMAIKAYRKPYNADQLEEPGDGQRVGLPVFMQLAGKIEEAMKAGVIRGDLGSPMLVAQTFWASIHGLVALLIARPRPHFPWEDRNDLIRALTDMLLNGLLAGAATDS